MRLYYFLRERYPDLYESATIHSRVERMAAAYSRLSEKRVRVLFVNGVNGIVRFRQQLRMVTCGCPDLRLVSYAS